MSDVFQIAAIGMSAGQQRLAAISQNAASASLPGYRRQITTGRAFDAALAGSQPVKGVDLQAGSILSTGGALDVSIDADRLFFALTDGEQTWLTRAGSFHRNADGVLVGERGLRVVGAQGDVQLPDGDVEMSGDGRILHEGTPVAALQLFEATRAATLAPAGGALLNAMRSHSRPQSKARDAGSRVSRAGAHGDHEGEPERSVKS